MSQNVYERVLNKAGKALEPGDVVFGQQGVVVSVQDIPAGEYGYVQTMGIVTVKVAGESSQAFAYFQGLKP